jgi:hypothetical protein
VRFFQLQHECPNRTTQATVRETRRVTKLFATVLLRQCRKVQLAHGQEIQQLETNCRPSPRRSSVVWKAKDRCAFPDGKRHPDLPRTLAIRTWVSLRACRSSCNVISSATKPSARASTFPRRAEPTLFIYWLRVFTANSSFSLRALDVRRTAYRPSDFHPTIKSKAVSEPIQITCKRAQCLFINFD